MKRWSWIALVAFLIPVVSFAQTEVENQRLGISGSAPRGNPVGGMNPADSTFHLIPISGSGTSSGMSVIDPERDRDANILFQSIIDNASIAYNVGDSSAILNTHDLAHAVLWIKATPLAGDTNTVNRLAIQVRGHLNGLSDSSSTFAFYPVGMTNLGITTTGDSLTEGHNVKGGRGGVVGAPWSGEFVVNIAGSRSAHGSAIAVNGHDWYYPNGIAVPLDNLFGRGWWSPYTSVRVRNLTGSAIKVTMHLVGTPL